MKEKSEILNSKYDRVNNKYISVVIPMYNAASTVADAVESVRKQNFNGKIEIIIINDGSTDNSLDIINQYKYNYDKLNIIIINKSNGGVASARNAGIKAAKGEFIAFLDSDDEWLEHKLKTVMPYFDQAKIECIGSSRNNHTLKCGFKHIKKLTRIYPIDLVFRMNPHPSSIVFRKSVFNKIGFYNENLKYGEDNEYWERIAHYCRFFVIPDSLIITGHGKCDYGESGLSANLNEMHKGELYAISNTYKIGAISLYIYYIANIFARIKYIRRKFIVLLRKMNDKSLD